MLVFTLDEGRLLLLLGYDGSLSYRRLLLRDKGYMRRSLSVRLSAGRFKVWNCPNAWDSWEVLLEIKSQVR